ncbi:hypothetical protein CISIN_1g044361mg, partial [Citrus sinensis]
TLLVNMGWENALVLREPVYLNLVRVFYSNMIISSNTASRIVTNIAGILIEFDVKDLNMILRTKDEGFHVYTSRNVVQNICRRSDLSEQFCNSALKSQALPLQVQVLHSVFQHVISHQKGHGDEVSILHMLNTPNTCILKHFRVPISEPSHDESRELEDEVIASLGFVWESG